MESTGMDAPQQTFFADGPQAATLGNPVVDWLRDALTPDSGDTGGVAVSAKSVRGLPGAWYSVNKIAGHVGILPCNLYERDPVSEYASQADKVSSYWLVKHQPNDLMTAAVFKETLQHHALLHGNGRAAILRNARQEPAQLIPLQPDKWAIIVEPSRDMGNGVMSPQRKWHVRRDNPEVAIDDKDVLHIMGLSDDGISGLGVIDAAKQALGLAIGQQRQAVYATKNGARVKFLISAPEGAFKADADAKKFISDFNDYHAGSENTDKVGLLTRGMKPEQISQTNSDAQFIESRKFSRQDVGLLFLVEQMLGDDSSVSYNSLEMKNQAYLTNCLMRWLVRWEQELRAKLLTKQQKDSERFYFKFVTAALLRGTSEQRFKTYLIGRQIGVFSANEVRELEDMNERLDPGGDAYDNPLITTTTPSAASAPQENSGNESDQPAPSARLRNLIYAHLSALVRIERSRAEAAAIKETNYVSWIDTFYAEWSAKFSKGVADCEGAESIASQWVETSRERLLDVAGKCQPRELAEAIRVECATWDSRLTALIDDVLNGVTTSGN